MRRFMPVMGVALASLMASACAGISSGGGFASSGSATQRSPAYELAVIDGDSSGNYVAREQAALDSLSMKCREGESRLSDFAANSMQIMEKDKGINESTLSILHHVKSSIPKALGVTRCQDIFAAYVTIREG